jgi:prepilin-type processing-associated H-X9-DG protein
VDRSFLVAILPQLDQASLFNSVNSSTWILGRENSTIRATSIATYVCPSDPRAFGSIAVSSLDPEGPGSTDRASRTSYGGFFGSLHGWGLPHYLNDCQVRAIDLTYSNGCFNDVSPITWSSVRDGLSQTLIVADKSVTQLSLYHHPKYPRAADDTGWWVYSQIGHAGIDASHPPNAYRKSDPRNFAGWLWNAASLHPGGVNGLMADGSVHFFTDTIDAAPIRADGLSSDAGFAPRLWQKLVTRDDGELIDWPN